MNREEFVKSNKFLSNSSCLTLADHLIWGNSCTASCWNRRLVFAVRLRPFSRSVYLLGIHASDKNYWPCLIPAPAVLEQHTEAQICLFLLQPEVLVALISSDTLQSSDLWLAFSVHGQNCVVFLSRVINRKHPFLIFNFFFLCR